MTEKDKTRPEKNLKKIKSENTKIEDSKINKNYESTYSKRY